MTTDNLEVLKSEVLAAEENRCAQISASNWAALEDILSDDFTYTHSTGLTENKADWIRAISKRPRTYVRDNLAARIYGDGEVAVVTGGLTNTGTSPKDGSPTKLVLVVLQVWNKRDGRWQLVANAGVKNEIDKGH